MILLRVLASAYLVSGGVHVLKTLALAGFVSRGSDPAKAYQGRMVLLGLLRVTPGIYVGMLLGWPAAVYNGLRQSRRGLLLVMVEPITFLAALLGLIIFG